MQREQNRLDMIGKERIFIGLQIKTGIEAGIESGDGFIPKLYVINPRNKSWDGSVLKSSSLNMFLLIFIDKLNLILSVMATFLTRTLMQNKTI